MLEKKSFDLPSSIPIFPLSGALLFPFGRLPLNIFEPRYIAMIDMALAHDRFVGMIQPKTVGDGRNEDCPYMYDIGCLGRISTFVENDVDQYSIILSGYSRFKIIKEVPSSNKWKTVIVDYSSFVNDLKNIENQNFSRQNFLKIVQEYFSIHGMAGSWDSIGELDVATLIASIAMAVPLSPHEKQAILECESITEQSLMLQSLMEMEIYQKGNPESETHH